MINRSLDRDVVIKSRSSRRSSKTGHSTGPSTVFLTNSAMRNNLQKSANEMTNKTKNAT